MLLNEKLRIFHNVVYKVAGFTPLVYLLADIAMQWKKNNPKLQRQNYSGKIECKKYEHRKAQDSERRIQTTADWQS